MGRVGSLKRIRAALGEQATGIVHQTLSIIIATPVQRWVAEETEIRGVFTAARNNVIAAVRPCGDRDAGVTKGVQVLAMVMDMCVTVRALMFVVET